MAYTVNVKPAHVREAQIAERAAECTKTEPFYEYQSQPHDLPIVHVPLGLPIYRMANFRTRTAQQAYARREGKSADYFASGEENEAAQQRQHEFLLKYANTGREGSIAPIIDVLKAEGQRQPILITRRGVVVNGNRRLAAMRALYDEDPNLYREFATVKCQLLPATATENDIVEVEVRLQMKQRTELDYDWINECIAIRELRDSGRAMKELMALMNKKKVEIDDAINALTEADLYLVEWLNRGGDYEAIEDAKQLFFDIGENVKSKTGETQEVSRRIAWLLADRRSKLKRRVYDFKPMFGKKSDEVTAKLAERFGVELDDSGSSDDGDGEDFAVDLGGNSGPTLRPLISLIDDATRREEVSDQLVEVCESIIEMERDKRDGQMPLNLIQTANGKLSEVDMTRAAPGSLDAIGKQLDAVLANVNRLRGFLERQRAETKPGGA
ncbi:hypothetical protein [Robbsia andropogonis]|uniref:hypothetical protein n=1 Tax=Robbsia andropogonis TaxID=28092 RepID=UPI00209D0767|nr:hypothetical protein [Robbsia andropogonis]MCP1121271.1 hypothetical protein [Robbsia andropogonis]MCP1131064.1 hypothetical protein [Robbsia andropogonis]